MVEGKLQYQVCDGGCCGLEGPPGRDSGGEDEGTGAAGLLGAGHMPWVRVSGLWVCLADTSREV